MTRYETKRLPAAPDAAAPDGSAVRVLLRVEGGSMAHFELGAGETSTAVAHRTVEEIWYFLEARVVVGRWTPTRPGPPAPQEL